MVYPHTYRTEHSETKTTNSVYGEYYAAKTSKKIKIQPDLLKILQYIDSNRALFLEDLTEIVKIKSVSSKQKYRDDVYQMIHFTEEWLKKLEMKYECFNIGHYVLEGKKVRIPSVILASLGNDPQKKTVCAYLHLDVPEPRKDEWKTDPWTLTQINNCFYGNGASCGKGPLMMWFHVIQAFQGSNMPLPVNIKFIIEFMNHEDSCGLAGFLPTRVQDFFAGVYNLVVCESEWIGEKHPCLIYGCVGMIHFELAITKTENSKTDIKDDMDTVVSNLVDDKENILITNFGEYVEQITPDEEKVYENIKDFEPDDIRDSLPDFKKSWDQVKLLMSFWRLPSLYVHETLECVCDKKDYSKIKKIFTIKIVPRQVVDKVEKFVRNHIKTVVKEKGIENTVAVKMIHSKRPWFENFRLPCYHAARRAITQIYKEDPNMIREAKAREAVTILDRILEKSILMLPLTCRGSNPGESNENITSRNYYEGTKVIAAYLFQTSYIKDN
ncbi:cytosolic non-specific dipeptidase-like [Anthonomus grandis grandis]|uniref:cytosolic non-specific dipeptidase-like n=1 Tax=Anthonomus grandis grandis TaxID=2921223 RepID=UPI0021658528|nr:cytosolic non-specific dipeptidase-like [Anthonomus grandis grandis]